MALFIVKGPVSQRSAKKQKGRAMKRKKPSFSVFSFCVAMMIVFGFASAVRAAAPPPKTLKIGVMCSLTGMMSAGYKDVWSGVKPAERFINEMGGVQINGERYRVELELHDDQSTPSGAVSAMNKVAQDKLGFLVAPAFAPSNLAIAPIAEREKIIRVQSAPFGTEQYGPNNRYMFAAYFLQIGISPVYDYLAKTYPRVKRLARLIPDDPGVKHFKECDTGGAQKHGFQFVSDETFRTGSEDFYPLLTKALEKKPDAIDLGFSILPWAKAIITQSRELGFDGPIYASGVVGDINLLVRMLDPENGHDVFHAGPDVLNPKMPRMIQDFRKVVEKDLGVSFTLDHTKVLESAWVLVKAIEKAQSLDPDKVVAAWEKMQTIDSIFGKSRMGGQSIIGVNHVVMRPVLISRIVAKNKPIESDSYESKE